MSDLSDYTENLKRAVAVPGTFASVFPDTSDDDLTGTMTDAFAEAQLDGFFNSFSINEDGITTPDVTPAQLALVLLYASARILSNEILSRRTHRRYEAGSVVFEEDQGSQMLSEMLKAITARKRELLAQAQRGQYSWNGDAGFTMADLAFIKGVEFYGPMNEYDYGDALGW